VDGLRKAGRQDYLPRGLLALAELHRFRRDFDQARADLEEAWEIAEFGEMKRHLTDYHLESFRLHRAMGDAETAETHRRKAEALIQETGYHRRDKEVQG